MDSLSINHSSMQLPIPFNRPHIPGNTTERVQRVLSGPSFSGGGPECSEAERRLRELTGATYAALTPTGTAALEMACILLDIGPGDEVIVPSFTFTSTANVVATRGATPVFVDIQPDTLNILVSEVAAAITPRTKAVIIVHYAGNPSDIDAINKICLSHGIVLIEDAAHAIHASYKSKHIGSTSPICCFSFHETKNIQCGEGGALLLRDGALIERACVVRDKGTNRAEFERGTTERYRWVGTGGGFKIPEISAAILNTQLQCIDEITADRIRTWNKYFDALEPAENAGYLSRPLTTFDGTHNAHIFYVILQKPELRAPLLRILAEEQIEATSHYTALHESPAGIRYGRTANGTNSLPNATHADRSIVRLPLWFGMTWEPGFVADRVTAALAKLTSSDTTSVSTADWQTTSQNIIA